MAVTMTVSELADRDSVEGKDISGVFSVDMADWIRDRLDGSEVARYFGSESPVSATCVGHVLANRQVMVPIYTADLICMTLGESLAISGLEVHPTSQRGASVMAEIEMRLQYEDAFFEADVVAEFRQTMRDEGQPLDHLAVRDAARMAREFLLEAFAAGVDIVTSTQIKERATALWEGRNTKRAELEMRVAAVA